MLVVPATDGDARLDVNAGGYSNGRKMRAVTNLHVTPDDVEYTIASIRELLA